MALIDFFSFLRRPKVRFEGACARCGTCCKNVVLVDGGKPVQTVEHFEKLVRRKPEYRRFVPRHEYMREGFLYVSCEMLADDNTCIDYENRPRICRDYPSAAMLRHGGKLLPGCAFKVVPKRPFSEVLAREMDKQAG